MRQFLLFSILAGVAGAQIPAEVTALPTGARERAIWNEIFAKQRMKFRTEASRFVRDSVAGVKPGRALDLGAGTGRNALYLAAEGWRVTCVDVSDVALGEAAKSAQSSGLSLDLVNKSLDEFDAGEKQWDLIVLSYMQFWLANASPDQLKRVVAALKPGGLLVVEGFAAEDAPGGKKMGFADNALIHAFAPALRILRYSDAREDTDWKPDTSNRIMRMVAQRP